VKEGWGGTFMDQCLNNLWCKNELKEWKEIPFPLSNFLGFWLAQKSMLFDEKATPYFQVSY